MRKRIAILMTILIVLSCLNVYTGKAYAEDDVTAPVIVSLSVDKNNVKAGDTVTFTMVVDDESSIKLDNSYVTLGLGNNVLIPVYFSSQEGGTITGSVAIDSTWSNGGYFVAFIRIEDEFGNVNDQNDYTALKVDITGGVKEDWTLYMGALTVDKPEVTNGDKVNFVLECQNMSISDLRYPYFVLLNETCNDEKTVQFVLQEDGTYKGTVYVNEEWFDGEYFVDRIYTRGKNRAVRINENYKNTKISVSGCYSDETPPEIKSLTADNKIVTSGDTVSFLMEAEDDVGIDLNANVTYLDLYNEESNNHQTVTFKKQNDGTYIGGIDVTSSWVDGDYCVWTVYLQDIYGNKTNCTDYRNVIIENHDFDHPTYNWSDDCSKCTVTRKCKNHSDYSVSDDMTITSTIIKEATCVEKGITRYTAVYGRYSTNKDLENIDINPDNHTGETLIENSVVATCTSDGYSGDKYCKSCDKLIERGSSIKATGHKEVVDSAVEPTETSTGLTEGSHCSVCGAVMKAQEIIYFDKCPEGNGVHVWKWNKTIKSPTCTEEGIDEYKCSKCSRIKHESLSKIAHSTTIYNAKSPNYDFEGYTGDKICTICGKTVEKGSVISKKSGIAATGKYKQLKDFILAKGVRVDDELVIGFNDEVIVKEIDPNQQHNLYTISYSSETGKFYFRVFFGDKYWIEFTMNQYGSDVVYIDCIDESGSLDAYTYLTVSKYQKDSSIGFTMKLPEANLPRFKPTIEKLWNAILRLGFSGWTYILAVNFGKDINMGDLGFVSYATPGNHTWDEGVITTAPTATKSGVKTYTCSVCGIKKTETIPPTGTGGNSSSSTYKNEWVNGKWYDADGKQTYTGTLHWKCNSTGYWVEDTSGWYPADQWQKIDGIWYYFKPDGYMAANEYYKGYWFNADGSWDDKYLLSWKSNATGWWVEDISGWWPSSMWLKIDGYWYYFKADGYMASSQYVDGYWISSDGVCY